MTRCGMVSIVGRPNVGKSTLLNAILEEKVAIVSKIPQTTRQQIRGIYTEKRGQIVFIDTPGFHIGHDGLDKYMNQSSVGTLDEVDCIIYLVDLSRRLGPEEESIAEKVKQARCPVILGLNKVDVYPQNLPLYISFWEKIVGKSVHEMEKFMLIPLSGQEGTNIDKLLDIIFGFLPEGELLYPDNIISDMPQNMMIADIIREKLFHLMHHEIPHSLGVKIEDIQKKKNKVLHIKALIYVERESQKEIVIGKKGDILKQVGTLARVELEDLLEKRIFLELFVKVQERWREDFSFLEDAGYRLK
ncbi:MAG TPA: GTPase Era [Candidatus Omnitrophota bacterium]|nr:GTPase Era [Candidatus Omnitrophota bacterium]HPN88316.1 GTPase Era [Candidatus Omnitrophota bacterium]